MGTGNVGAGAGTEAAAPPDRSTRGRPPGRPGPPPGRGRTPAPSAPFGPPEPWAGPGRADDPRRRKGSPAARFAGWGDQVTRVTCACLIPRLPAAFPVATHPGAATLPIRQVAARPGALLLCDDGHAGPHLWADGEPVAEDELGAPTAVALRPPPMSNRQPGDAAAAGGGGTPEPGGDDAG